jgi:hypothetical protein
MDVDGAPPANAIAELKEDQQQPALASPKRTAMQRDLAGESQQCVVQSASIVTRVCVDTCVCIVYVCIVHCRV